MWTIVTVLTLMISAAVWGDSCTVNGVTWNFTVANGEVSLGAEGVFVGDRRTAVDDSYAGPLEIPEALNGFPVTSIGYWAFYGIEGLTSVTIPNTVTNIEPFAFSRCVGLTSITIPSSVANISYSAFSDCRNLTSLAIPSSMTRVVSGAFSGCDLKSVEVPGECFGPDFGTATNLVMTDGTKCIKDYAFWRNPNLISVTIPASVTNVGESAFAGCSRLNSVTMADGMTGVGKGAFASCESLTSMEFPPSLTTIADGVLQRCGSLASVLIPAGVTNIGARAFADCVNLALTAIPEGVVDIGEGAFAGCSSLNSVAIPSSVVGVGPGAFDSCRGMTTLSIAEGVERIGKLAFSCCESLRTLTIPASVASIGEDAFCGCTGLTMLEISDGVPCIGDYAFLGCSGLRSVAIPPSVVEIGSGAFCNCEGLASVMIANGVLRIGEDAFANCSGMRSLVIPSSVIEFGDWAFGGCGPVTSATLPGHSCGVDLEAVTNLVISEGTKTVADHAFQYCRELESLTIPSSVTDIGELAFYGCTDLKVLNIPEGVERVMNSAFGFCDELTTVNIPSSLVHIDESAFFSCCNLRSFNVDERNQRYSSIDGLLCTKDGKILLCGVNGDVIIPSTVTNIASWAFANLTNLASVVIPPSVVSIGNEAFFYCEGLASVTLSEGLKEIGLGAFEMCWSLGRVTIPSSVASIGTFAFCDCGSMQSVTYLGDAPFCGDRVFEGTPIDMVVHVPADSTGWTTWQGRQIHFDVEGGQPGSGTVPGGTAESRNVSLVVTNVVVHYILNSVQPEAATPISADTGFVNVITEVKGGGPVAIPESWAENFTGFATKFGNDFTKAVTMPTGKRDGAGNPMLVWQDYVAGTDPTNPDDRFTASITTVDGKPVISFTPELPAARAAQRIYRIFGKVDLADAEWIDVTSLNGKGFPGYHFFKVRVEMR